MTTETADLTIHKTLHVAVPLEQAFDVFTTGIASWWPVATHSVAGGELTVDWRVGGMGVELVDGVRHEWFDVVEYSPPHPIGLRWRVTPESPLHRPARDVRRGGRRHARRADPRRLGGLRRRRRRAERRLQRGLGHRPRAFHRASSPAEKNEARKRDGGSDPPSRPLRFAAGASQPDRTRRGAGLVCPAFRGLRPLLDPCQRRQAPDRCGRPCAALARPDHALVPLERARRRAGHRGRRPAAVRDRRQPRLAPVPRRRRLGARARRREIAEREAPPPDREPAPAGVRRRVGAAGERLAQAAAELPRPADDRRLRPGQRRRAHRAAEPERPEHHDRGRLGRTMSRPAMS